MKNLINNLCQVSRDVACETRNPGVVSFGMCGKREVQLMERLFRQLFTEFDTYEMDLHTNRLVTSVDDVAFFCLSDKGE